LNYITSILIKLEKWYYKKKYPHIPEEITISNALDVMGKW
jgi:hypothetical protein